MTLSEIRKTARESLTGKWGFVALFMLIFSLIDFGINFIYTKLNSIPVIGFSAYWALLIISVPISYRTIFCFLELKRMHTVELIDYFKYGFSNFKKVWCIIGNIFKKIWIYILIYVIIIFATVFCGVFISGFALAYKSSTVSIVGLFFMLILLAGLITTLVLLLMKSFLYALTPYIAWDNPEMTAKDIVEQSESLMNGNRGKLFSLALSFIGWFILSIFTFGIGLLWLIPYMQVSFAAFYESLIKDTNTNLSNIEINK